MPVLYYGHKCGNIEISNTQRCYCRYCAVGKIISAIIIHMTRIEKKMWPESYQKVLLGEKTYDLRLADWKVEPGDTILFREWDPATKDYTGRTMEKQVGYVGKTKDWEVWPREDIEQYGYQIISLRDSQAAAET